MGLSFFENFENLTVNSKEIVKLLENNKLSLKTGKKDTIYELDNINLNLIKADAIFIPVHSIDALEDYTCTLYTNTFWGAYHIDAKPNKNKNILNNKERDRLFTDINNELINL